MDERQKKMEKQVDQLVELANRSKGGLWLGMTIVATLSAVAGFIGAYFKSH